MGKRWNEKVKTNPLLSAFVWERTPEGLEFWRLMNNELVDTRKIKGFAI
jgi:hypothetical protein